ncbi:MAG: putative selenium-dependent hydroxylase accessory protein YqeC [Candidatus Marinimicrobia bacterium]|nr:putative selenium-dependent hydroxylase accessory protein YqeC [Candidatus Neomarinimicrobiota bacterium]
MTDHHHNLSHQPFIHILGYNSKDGPSPCIAFLGGGGKSSLISQMGEEFSRIYSKVALTSLTKSGIDHRETVCFPDKFAGCDLSVHFTLANPLKILRQSNLPDKLNGVSVDELNDIWRQSDVCLFECDGARKLPLKVHLDHDPEVPNFATHVVIIVGADVVGTTPAEGLVHRADRFCNTWEISPNSVLIPDFIATVISSQKGYSQKIPKGIKRVYYVNKADAHPKNAEELATIIWEKTKCPTYFGSVQQKFWKAIS